MTALESSRDELLALCQSLPAEVANRQPEAGRWNIAQHVEHLATVERNILAALKRRKGETASQEDLAATAGKEELILNRVPQVLQRIEAPEQAQPNGRYGDWPSPLDAFAKARGATIDFAAEAAAEELSRVVMPHMALGHLNGRQWLLFCAAHTQRHCGHIRGLLQLFANTQ
jgi:uncharacterized damage-inducible protein DinB